MYLALLKRDVAIEKFIRPAKHQLIHHSARETKKIADPCDRVLSYGPHKVSQGARR